MGPFYTQGIAEETSAFRAGILSKAEFLVQSHKVLADSLRLYRYELDRFQEGLFFYYFSSVDQNSHMLWGRYDDDLLEIYRAVDQAIGQAIDKAGTDTPLLVISDHGFAPFNRAVHLNSFLSARSFLPWTIRLKPATRSCSHTWTGPRPWRMRSDSTVFT